MNNEYKVTAARIARTGDDEISPREEVIERVQKQIREVYDPLFDSITEELYKVIPENDWYWKEYDEVKSVTKNPNIYKGIALDGDFYQIKYEITRYRAERIMESIPVSALIDALSNAIGRRPDSSSKKPYQYSSVAYRNLWYFKENNLAVVTRINFRDYDGNETITNRTFLEISWFIYYNILESDLKVFLEKIPLSDQIIEQAFNVAGRGVGDRAFALNLPIQTLSLNIKRIPKKFKEYNQLFKLPDASIISLKYTDMRKEIEDFVEKATGIRECPAQLPRWFAPPEGVLYTSDGATPDYISGDFPYAKGKLKDNDVSKYTFRVCTKKEAEERDDGTSAYQVPIPGEEDKTAYLIREEPRATVWQDYINKIFWTDFENSFVFYYNREGYLQKVDIQGYQEVSDNDIVRLFYSGLTDTQIDLSVAIVEGGREEKWFETYPKESQKFKAMCLDLIENVKDYTNLSGDDLTELLSSARHSYVVSSAVISNYAKTHPEFKDLFVMFFNQVGAIDATNKRNESWGNRDAVALAKLMELGIDYDKARENVIKLEKEHLEIARDPKANTPFLPKDIKNFTTKWPLFAQQAIAVSMANNQKNAILDVDMGGGKTCMMVADICNQLSKGTAHKPLIVCPNKTLVQNKNEIYERWTDKRMNVFIINTETYNNITNRGKDVDKLIEVMNKMPPNTIFMTSYDFLIRDKYEVPLQEKRDKNGDLVDYEYTTVYPIPKLLLQEVGIDMVYCDESQAIKNSKSGRSEAVAALSGAKIKRITSGTIIPNNPVDLFAQLRFVDPSILGTYDSFIHRYAEEGSRGKVTKWKEGAQKRIREEIEKKGGVSIRRSMWRWMMPKLNEQVHFVSLTQSQAQLYEYLMSLAIDNIMKDKKLRAAYEALKEAGEETGLEEDQEEGSIAVLKIFQKVTGYLAAPETHELVDEFDNLDKSVVDAMDFTEEDFVGPKIYKMRSIIEKHFAGQTTWKNVGKIIVFTERVPVAQHAFNYLGDMQEHAVWYRAGRDDELERFKSDDDIWILVAVDKSIKEGQNLQMASRIIRLDIPWTPGDLNQSYARAYRTRQEKDVNVDLILCNGTMEICKYNNLISKEYIARKIISSFDEGDDADFIPVRMNIPNMQQIKWDTMCEPYIEMHKRINDQELEESKIFGDKYKNYMASGVSNVGSTEDLPGSKMVYVPETKEDRIIVDEDGKVVKTKSGYAKRKKVSYDVDDIGVDLDLLKGKYDEDDADDDDSVDINPDDFDDVEVNEDDKNDTGLHLYFLQFDTAEDSELFLMTFFNKSSAFLKRLRFQQDPFTYVKPLNTIEDLKSIGKKLKKQGYTTNIEELAESKEVRRLFAKPKKAGALQRLKKHFVATSASKELEFYIARMEGQLFLISYTKLEGFTKIARTLFRTIDNKAMAEKVLKMIAKEAEITNLDELAIDFKVRFKTDLDVEKLGLVKSSKKEKKESKITKTREQPKKEKVLESSKYNGKQIVLGIFEWAKKNSQIVSAYNFWTSDTIGGLDFKELLKKKGCSNVSQSVKYLLENNNKTTATIFDWINKRRGSVVARFLNKYKRESFGSFTKIESFVKKISK